MGTQPLPKKWAWSPQFSAHVYCSQAAAWIKVPLGSEVGLGPDDSLSDGDPAPLPKKGGGAAPQFSAHFYCGQTAGCIKMPLGMEVGLISRDFVLDGDPAPLPKRRRSPSIFSSCLLWPNGWMDEDATLYGGWPRPRRYCVRWESSYCLTRGTATPFFGPCRFWPNG